MIKLFLPIFVFSLLIVSCKESSEKIIPGYVYRSDSLYKTLKYRIKVKNLERGKVTEISNFRNTKNTINWEYVTYKNVDSIMVHNLNCPLIDQVEFNGKIFYKYRFDEIESVDEECDIYLDENQELMAMKSVAWTGYELFGTNESFHKFLLNDTTEYFRHNYKFRFKK